MVIVINLPFSIKSFPAKKKLLGYRDPSQHTHTHTHTLADRHRDILTFILEYHFTPSKAKSNTYKKIPYRKQN